MTHRSDFELLMANIYYVNFKMRQISHHNENYTCTLVVVMTGMTVGMGNYPITVIIAIILLAIVDIV